MKLAETYTSPNRFEAEGSITLASLREVQNKVCARDRILIANQLAAETNKVIPAELSGDGAGELEQLRKIGIVNFVPGPSPETCRAVVDYFTRTPCYPAHVAAYCDANPQLPQEISAISNYGSYKIDQSLKAPFLLEFALNRKLLDLVGGYLGCTPTLYSINTFWTFPHQAGGLTHDYHRDEDDFRFLAVFIYWTEVTPGEGEFYFIPQTHDRDQMNAIIAAKRKSPFTRWGVRKIRDFEDFRRLNRGNGYGKSKLYRRMFKDNVLSLAGPASTTFVADTFGIHRGSSPRSKPRLVTWIRYGLYANDVYVRDKTEPLPARDLTGFRPTTDREKYITRLIVAPG